MHHGVTMTDPFQLPLLLEEPGPKDETPLALWTVEDQFAAAS